MVFVSTYVEKYIYYKNNTHDYNVNIVINVLKVFFLEYRKTSSN